MTATTVGADWGMAALGVHETPRKEREVVVRAGSLAARYGEHAAISNVVIDRRRDVARLLELLGPTTSAASVMLVRLRQGLRESVERQILPSVEDETGQSEVIHSVHGVSVSGDWFLLADVGAAQPDSDQLSQTSDPPRDCFSDSWLVVVGGCSRDMISADALDPTPAYAR